MLRRFQNNPPSGGHFLELSSWRTSPGGSRSEDHPEISAIPAILKDFWPLSREFETIFDPKWLPARHSWVIFGTLIGL